MAIIVFSPTPLWKIDAEKSYSQITTLSGCELRVYKSLNSFMIHDQRCSRKVMYVPTASLCVWYLMADFNVLMKIRPMMGQAGSPDFGEAGCINLFPQFSPKSARNFRNLFSRILSLIMLSVFLKNLIVNLFLAIQSCLNFGSPLFLVNILSEMLMLLSAVFLLFGKVSVFKSILHDA